MEPVVSSAKQTSMRGLAGASFACFGSLVSPNAEPKASTKALNNINFAFIVPLLLLVHLIDFVLQHELNILSERKPGQRLRILRCKLEILRRAELNPHALCVLILLYRGISPLRIVLE